MVMPSALKASLRMPVVGAPMIIASGPGLVVAQCKAGVVGSFPALNARPAELLDDWLNEITKELEAFKKWKPDALVAPFAVSQVSQADNVTQREDLDTCVRHRVPIMITGLRDPDEVVEAAHSYGGLVFHEVTTIASAKRALCAGVDGLILVCAGAGGRAGRLSPFAFLHEVRQFYDGCVILSGAIANGRTIFAARALGADLAYVGTPFIASVEANAQLRYKQMVVDSTAEDIVCTSLFNGVHGNYLRASIEYAGLDPESLPESHVHGDGTRLKVRRDIWGAGQDVGQVREIQSVQAIVDEFAREYRAAESAERWP